MQLAIKFGYFDRQNNVCVYYIRPADILGQPYRPIESEKEKLIQLASRIHKMAQNEFGMGGGFVSLAINERRDTLKLTMRPMSKQSKPSQKQFEKFKGWLCLCGLETFSPRMPADHSLSGMSVFT